MYSGAPYVSTLSPHPLQPFHPLVCPGPPPFFYVFFAADLDNYFLRTNNNNIEQQQQQPAAALSRHILPRSRAHRAPLPPCSVRVSSTCPASDPAPIGNASGAPTDRGSVHSVTPGVNEHSLIGRLIPRCCVRGVPSKQGTTRAPSYPNETGQVSDTHRKRKWCTN